MSNLITDNLTFYHSQHEEVLSDFYIKVQKTIDEAASLGWINIKVFFESTIEPYEDWPGDVLIKVEGERAMNQRELSEYNEVTEIKKLAEAKRITFWQAKQYFMLKEGGII